MDIRRRTVLTLLSFYKEEDSYEEKFGEAKTSRTKRRIVREQIVKVVEEVVACDPSKTRGTRRERAAATEAVRVRMKNHIAQMTFRFTEAVDGLDPAKRTEAEVDGLLHHELCRELNTFCVENYVSKRMQMLWDLEQCTRLMGVQCGTRIGGG